MKDKLLTLAILTCVIGSIVSMSFFCLPEQPNADLEVLPNAFQKVGPVRQDTQTNVDYTLRNRAPVPIHILDVVTSCPCSGVELPRRELAPGESVPLALKFHSGGLRGSIIVRVVIAYKRQGEGQSRLLRISAQVEIDPDYAVEPEQLEFGDGRPLVQRVAISPRHISDLRIEKATCNLRFFKARVLPKGVSNKQEIEVTFLPEGYYPDAGSPKLMVSTDSKRQPTLIVPLRVTVYTTPSRARIHQAASGE